MQMTRHGFASLSGVWSELLARCPANTLFLTPAWQRLWWERFGGDEDSLMLLLLEDEGRPIGVAPLRREGPTVSFLGDTDLFDYHDFIVVPGTEDAFYRSLVDRLAEEPWEQLYLASLPEGSAALSHIPELARSRGWTCQVEREDTAPGVELPGDWDAFLASLTKKHRHELRRKLRRLQSAEGVKATTLESREAVEGAFDTFLDLMQQSREDKRQFLTPEREDFFRAAARELADAGVLRLWLLEVGGRPVSTTLCFDYDGKRLLYNSGFDPAYSDLSVGLLLKAMCIRDAIDRGLRYFDFLRGDEAYKYHLGGHDRLVYRMTVNR